MRGNNLQSDTQRMETKKKKKKKDEILSLILIILNIALLFPNEARSRFTAMKGYVRKA